MKERKIAAAYRIAKEKYAEHGIDIDAAMKRLEKIPVSIHCWQGDDVSGFETPGAELSGGGIQATGNYPGKARTIGELRGDIEKALTMIPGRHRLNFIWAMRSPAKNCCAWTPDTSIPRKRSPKRYHPF